MKEDHKDLVQEVISPVQQKVRQLERKADNILEKVSNIESGLYENTKNIDKKLGVLVDIFCKNKDLEKELESTKANLNEKIHVLREEVMDLKSKIDGKIKKNRRGRSNSFS